MILIKLKVKEKKLKLKRLSILLITPFDFDLIMRVQNRGANTTLCSYSEPPYRKP